MGGRREREVWGVWAGGTPPFAFSRKSERPARRSAPAGVRGRGETTGGRGARGIRAGRRGRRGKGGGGRRPETLEEREGGRVERRRTFREAALPDAPLRSSGHVLRWGAIAVNRAKGFAPVANGAASPGGKISFVLRFGVGRDR